jgi:hypothetical protein
MQIHNNRITFVFIVFINDQLICFRWQIEIGCALPGASYRKYPLCGMVLD